MKFHLLPLLSLYLACVNAAAVETVTVYATIHATIYVTTTVGCAQSGTIDPPWPTSTTVARAPEYTFDPEVHGPGTRTGFLTGGIVSTIIVKDSRNTRKVGQFPGLP